VPIVDRAGGEVRPAYFFVAVLGASNYTYVEAALSQDSEAFLAAHVRAFEFYGGCARILVPDYVARNIIGHEALRATIEEGERRDVRREELGLRHAQHRVAEQVP
jgi:transposase